MSVPRLGVVRPTLRRGEGCPHGVGLPSAQEDEPWISIARFRWAGRCQGPAYSCGSGGRPEGEVSQVLRGPASIRVKTRGLERKRSGPQESHFVHTLRQDLAPKLPTIAQTPRFWTVPLHSGPLRIRNQRQESYPNHLEENQGVGNRRRGSVYHQPLDLNDGLANQ